MQTDVLHSRSYWTARAVFALAIATVFVAIAAAIGVGGDFPLSDDWSYAYSVRELCEHGRLAFVPWTGASLIFQAWYGAVLCKLFGFSFVALRISTLVLAASGVVALAWMLDELETRTPVKIMALVLFGLNPLYLNLSFTFMTDVPFTVFALWAGYFYVRGLRTGSLRTLLVASAVCSASILIRQHGVFVAAAAGLAAMVAPAATVSASRSASSNSPAAGTAGTAAGAPARARAGLRQAAAGNRMLRVLYASALPFAVTVVYAVWIFVLREAPSGLQNKVHEAGEFTWLGLGNAAFRGLAYLGLLLFPALLCLRRTLNGWLAGAALAIYAALLATAGFLYLREGALMPYLTNVIYDFGLGALSLRDTQFLGLPPPTHVGLTLGVVLTPLALTGAALLAAYWIRKTLEMCDPAGLFVTLAFVLLAAGSLLHARYYFDRYLLPVIPFALAFTLARAPRARPSPLAVLLAGALAWYAVAGTHDYLAWNRARFAALERLESRGVDARKIDGGFEYNAWRFAADMGTWPTDAEARPGQPASKKSWWWVTDDRFVVSFTPLAGYKVAERLPYQRWLGSKDDEVLLLERSGTDTPQPSPDPS